MPYSAWDRIWPLLIVGIATLIVFAIPIAVIRKMRRDRDPGSATSDGMGAARGRCMARADAAFKAWRQANPSTDPGPIVEIVYHTYSGFFIYTTQWRHAMQLPSHAARLMLSEMLRFNLTHGLLTMGAIFVPFLSWLEYRTQLRRIEQEEREV